jgi:O-antigen ligase
MAFFVAPRTLADPAHKQWLFRTRPLLVPAVALGVWLSYTSWVLPLFRTSFWGNLRWALLVVLAVQGLLEIWKRGGETPLSPPIVGFLLFSLATFASVTYSIIPLLSLYKAIAFLLALVGLVFGVGLRHRGASQSWLRLLATGNLAILVVSILFLPLSSAYDSGFLQGPFANPNSLGSSLALTFPALLWLREQYVRDAPLLFRSKLFTIAVFADVVLIFMSRSRSSLVAAALVLVLYAFLRASRFAWIIVYGMFVLLLAAPSDASQVGRDAAFKGRDFQGAFTTRIGQVDTTLNAARSNPISGYGFGTSVGETEWDGSLSAIAVGREKSNAYLGIVEEVGLVGAVPLVFGVLAALWIGFRSSRRLRRRGDGTTTALFAILAAGALNTSFEAWLTSIGSYEGFIFWATMGVFLMNVEGGGRPPAPEYR